MYVIVLFIFGPGPSSGYRICNLFSFQGRAVGVSHSEINVPSAECPELSFSLFFKSGLGQNIALHA